MTRAVILCGVSDGTPATDAVAIVERLRSQFTELGIAEILLVARPTAADRLASVGLVATVSPDHASDLALIRDIARRDCEPLVLCEGDLIAHNNALAEAVAEGIRTTTALVGARRRLDLHPPVLRQRGRIISVGSAYHRVSHANCALRGLVKVSPAELAALDDAATELAALTVLTGQSLESLAGTGGLVGLVVLALTRSGTPVTGYRVRLLVADRVTDADSLAAARRMLATVDENTVALHLAVKEHDDLFATYAVSSYSPRLVRAASRLRFNPTAITWISILFGVAAAACFGSGQRDLAVLGGLLLYIGFVFDCVDGQLARYTHRYSRFGGWLDVIADRAKEYLVYAGLAVGAARQGHDVWILAVGALMLQTGRHMTDTWYGALQDEAVSWLPRLALARRDDRLQDTETNGVRLTTRVGGALGRASARLESDRASFGYWVKRTVVFPIGERWLVIIVGTALFGLQVALIALLAWGVAALAYTVTGRVLRARAMRIAPLPNRGVPLHRDDGPIARALALVARGRPRPLLSAVAGLVVGVSLVVQATPGLTWATDLTREWVVVAGAVALLVASLAGRHPHDGPLDWLVPGVMRGAEAVFVVLVGINDRVPAPLILALLGAVALFNYDLAARLDKGSSPLRWRWLNLGWDGRVVILAVAAVLDLSIPVVAVLTAYLAVVFLVDSLGCLLAIRRTPGELGHAAPATPFHTAPSAPLGSR